MINIKVPAIKNLTIDKPITLGNMTIQIGNKAIEYEKEFHISLRDNNFGTYYTVPVLPETVSYQAGDTNVNSVNIINLGAVEFFNGTDLDNISWASFFPRRYDPSYCKVSEWGLGKPEEQVEVFNDWRLRGRGLQLIIPALNINIPVYIKSFSWDAKGFDIDIYYQLTLRQIRKISPKQIDTYTVLYKNTKGPSDRPSVTVKTKPTDYTVKKGDTLTGISKKLDVPDWKTIYAKNKTTIGPNPDLIYPGQVYKV